MQARCLDDVSPAYENTVDFEPHFMCKGVIVAAPDWIWFTFVFALGCCIGSFLNVVVYRLPRGKSLVSPGSACPACETPIRCYDNIPLLSWLILRAKCRHCRAPVSARYFVIELLTGLVYLGVFVAYFRLGQRPGMASFPEGGWLVYLLHIILLSAFIAASAIDLELWIIPLSLCWFVTGAGMIGSAVGGNLLPPAGGLVSSGPATGALALGALLGWALAMGLLKSGLITRSYDWEEEDAPLGEPQENEDHPVDHRREAAREMLFLAPILLCGVGTWWILGRNPGFAEWWAQSPVVAGLMGSVFGYFIGCAVVWGTRILGTLAFGKEAMGLGDVHLMGAAGAIVGAKVVFIAFFIAPFFGLGWALFQMFFRKTRQIPYGPFLSLGTFVVMIFYEWIMYRLNTMGM